MMGEGGGRISQSDTRRGGTQPPSPGSGRRVSSAEASAAASPLQHPAVLGVNKLPYTTSLSKHNMTVDVHSS